MQSTTLPRTASSQPRLSTPREMPVLFSARNSIRLQHACRLLLSLPAEQAERLISMLQDIAKNPTTEAPLNLVQPAIPSVAQTCSWLTHVEAASYLGVAVSTLYRYAVQERIECRKIGNRLEYRRSTLDRFKEQHIRPARRACR